MLMIFRTNQILEDILQHKYILKHQKDRNTKYFNALNALNALKITILHF